MFKPGGFVLEEGVVGLLMQPQRYQSSGFIFFVSGFRVLSLGSGFRLKGLGFVFRMWGLGFRYSAIQGYHERRRLLKRHLPRVIYHQVYWYKRKTKS